MIRYKTPIGGADELGGSLEIAKLTARMAQVPFVFVLARKTCFSLIKVESFFVQGSSVNLLCFQFLVKYGRLPQKRYIRHVVWVSRKPGQHGSNIPATQTKSTLGSFLSRCSHNAASPEPAKESQTTTLRTAAIEIARSNKFSLQCHRCHELSVT